MMPEDPLLEHKMPKCIKLLDFVFKPELNEMTFCAVLSKNTSK